MTTTPEQNISVTNRPGREQLEQIYDILDECFAVGREYFQERLDLDTSYDPDTTWFATVGGKVAANVQIFPLSIRVGQAVLQTGAMGSVAADPNYRGMGLTHKILAAQTHYMREAGYDISVLLASKHAFYEKAGWRLIPETAYAIENQARGGQPDGYEIIPFEPRYLEDIRAIYEQFNQNRTYTVVRNETYWKDLIRWPEWKKSDCLLLQHHHKIVAYGMIEKRTPNRYLSTNSSIWMRQRTAWSTYFMNYAVSGRRPSTSWRCFLKITSYIPIISSFRLSPFPSIWRCGK